MEQSFSYIEYNTSFLMNGRNIKATLRNKLYSTLFMQSFAEFVKAKFKDPRIQVELDPSTYKIKLEFATDTSNMNIALTCGIAMPAEVDELNVMTADQLFSLDYGQSLYLFILTYYKENLQTFLTKNDYEYFITHPNIGEYLVQVFKFSDANLTSCNNLVTIVL